jgi:NADPH:quinone reductase-like Zn-dependent oxidoreductase
MQKGHCLVSLKGAIKYCALTTTLTQVARALGATVVTTAGSPSKRALLRSLGAQHVSGSRDTAFVEDLALVAGGGVHAVLNTLTSPGMVSSAAALLRIGGRFVEIGKRDVTSPGRLAQERSDVGYGFLAMDFMPAAVLGGKC